MATAPGAGPLRHLVSFQKREEVNPDAPADYGNTRSDWVEQFRCHASRKPLKGGESVMASRLQGTQPYVMQIRQSAAARLMRTDWRGVDLRTGQVFQIKAISDADDRRAYLDVLVTEGVSA